MRLEKPAHCRPSPCHCRSTTHCADGRPVGSTPGTASMRPRDSSFSRTPGALFRTVKTAWCSTNCCRPGKAEPLLCRLQPPPRGNRFDAASGQLVLQDARRAVSVLLNQRGWPRPPLGRWPGPLTCQTPVTGAAPAEPPVRCRFILLEISVGYPASSRRPPLSKHSKPPSAQARASSAERHSDPQRRRARCASSRLSCAFCSSLSEL
jgi:hypothetical protein